ncbi:MAG: MlaD family protein [Hyphomicrobium aestuarii]|nr:MlaD family protein [Hyphomicrobium aestuarii]
MEIRARFLLIGLFTLASILAGFVFVYWMETAGGLGQRARYQINFDSTVSGLLNGSVVLFNGVRVGEVTKLALDPSRPRGVTVGIAIDAQTPVRADTKVGIEFQGLTGAPVVSLTGGSVTLPLLAATGGRPAELTAESDAGQALSQTAREVLRNIDKVVLENTDPLRQLISNIDKFSGALARNSDRVDGIVAGLERLTGGGQPKARPRIFELAAAHFDAPLERLPTTLLLLPEPVALSLFETEKIVVRTKSESGPDLGSAQWKDLLPKVLQAQLIRSFENAGHLGVIGRVPPDLVKADHQLLIEVRRFEATVDGALSADVSLMARIVDTNGRIIDARSISHGEPLPALEADVVASSLSVAFARAATEIVVWACATLIRVETSGPANAADRDAAVRQAN